MDPDGRLSIPRFVISIPVDAFFINLNVSWSAITQPIKAGAKKLGTEFVKTTFKKGFLNFLNALKNTIVKICRKVVPIIKKTVGWLFRRWTENLTETSLASMLIGALISVTTNSILDKIVDNITVFLSIGGLIAGFLDWITDGSLNNKIKLDFWRK